MAVITQAWSSLFWNFPRTGGALEKPVERISHTNAQHSTLFLASLQAGLPKVLNFVVEGVFNEPTSDLTKLLAMLVDSKNQILIPGWYSAVRHNTLTPALERLDALNPPEFTMLSYRETLGIPELRNEVSVLFIIFMLHAPYLHATWETGRGSGGKG